MRRRASTRLLNTDPPDHTRLRPLVQKAFTPRRAAQLRPRTEEIAAGLLDEMAARGDVADLLDGYARPLPVTVICELLGIPAADRGWIWVTVTDYGKRARSPARAAGAGCLLHGADRRQARRARQRPAVGARPRPRHAGEAPGPR